MWFKRPFSWLFKARRIWFWAKKGNLLLFSSQEILVSPLPCSFFPSLPQNSTTINPQNHFPCLGRSTSPSSSSLDLNHHWVSSLSDHQPRPCSSRSETSSIIGSSPTAAPCSPRIKLHWPSWSSPAFLEPHRSPAATSSLPLRFRWAALSLLCHSIFGSNSYHLWRVSSQLHHQKSSSSWSVCSGCCWLVGPWLCIVEEAAFPSPASISSSRFSP